MTTTEIQESTKKDYDAYMAERKANNSPDSPIPDYTKQSSVHKEVHRGDGYGMDKVAGALTPGAIKLQAKGVVINAHRTPERTTGMETVAHEFLLCAAKEMEARQTSYDMPEGERSMVATVEMFNSLTGIELTETQGWKFMVLLKMVRAEYNGYRKDDYVDGAAYFALSGESAAKE